MVSLCTELVYEISKLIFLLCNHTDPFQNSFGIKYAKWHSLWTWFKMWKKVRFQAVSQFQVLIYLPNYKIVKPQQNVDLLQAGQSGDRIPVGARFSAPIQTGPGAHPASCTMGTGSFPGVKRSGCGVDHPPPSSAKVIERVELYLYSPSGPSWPVLGWT
jgi:hypothetical protein